MNNYWTEEEKELKQDITTFNEKARHMWDTSCLIAQSRLTQFHKDKQAHEKEKQELINEIYDLCHNDANDKANLDDKYAQKLKDIKNKAIEEVFAYLQKLNINKELNSEISERLKTDIAWKIKEAFEK